MTEKMKYVNIMGNINDIDRVINKYISKFDIQLEYTSKELATEKDLTSIQTPNPYLHIYKKAEKMFKMSELKKEMKNVSITKDISEKKALEIIENASAQMDNMSKDLEMLKQKRDKYSEIAKSYEPFIDLDFNIENLSSFEYIKYQFGRMPVSSFKQFETFLYKDPELLFLSGKKQPDYIWGVYFVVDSIKEKTDSIFSSLYFEKMDLPLSLFEENLKGTPLSIYEDYKNRIVDLDKKIAFLETSKILELYNDKTAEVDLELIVSAYKKIQELVSFYDMRKYAAKTSNDFYIFVGWMTEKDTEKLRQMSENDHEVVFMIEEDNESIVSSPPTKLRNNFLFRPFEMFVKMYGLPDYDEIDPTPFVALTYTILFGIMFGDVGQGLVVSLLGFYLFKKKGMALGAIMSIIGISSAIFGVLFGSVFGFEFTPLWLHPPAQSNTILISTVVFGVFLILVSMIINIINFAKRKDFKRIIFDPNGVLGFIFYVSLLAIAYFSIIGQAKIAFWIVLATLVLPLICVVLRNPIIALLEGRKDIIKGGIGLFLFETVIEAFEMLLSYFTNTVSFVRVGAFALSHASMMGVVLMLSKTAAGSHNVIVIIFGNLLVMGLEGLIVGIQVLRLEFYEMFSRFYLGAGREFVPYKKSYE